MNGIAALDPDLRLKRTRQLWEALGWAERFAARWKALAPEPKAGFRPFRPGISVVIPERANADVLRETLEHAAAACRRLAEPWEMIVSSSGAPASFYGALAAAHSGVRWLYSVEPLWYCGAVDRGLRAARYDWVYLLNSDMLLEAEALEATLKWRSPRVFAIASQVFFRDSKRRREETGWTLYRAADGPIEIRDEVPDDDLTVRGTLYAGGGASLFRRSLLRRFARGSSVYLPFYWEDVEWGTRAWRSGYASLYCPDSRAWHGHRQTNRLFFSEAEIDRVMARNRVVFHFRNGPPSRSFEEFAATVDALDDDSLDEILAPRRIAQIAWGHFRSCTLPADHRALEGTWEKQYGHVGECAR